MDVKALAKSKRAHTQHHTKKSHGNHNAQKLKSPSPATNDAAKVPLGKQQVIEKKTHHPRAQGSSALPTNWDRYEEEGLDSGLVGVSPESASKISDDVVPKSKGADFRHLVAEAQSHAEKTFQGSPSLDELLPCMYFFNDPFAFAALNRTPCYLSLLSRSTRLCVIDV